MSAALAPLQTVTRNLPGFVRQPLIAVIGKECYTSLIWDINLSDTECIKYSLSKVLGLGLVAGGGIVKVPQIVKILRSHSARGLSLASYLLDTASLLIVVAYNARQRFPFSTYGENAFLSIQNVVIVILVIAYSHTSAKTAQALLFLGALAAGAFALFSESIVPMDLLRTLLAASIPLSLSSKLPQIAANFSNGSTGQLSAFLVFNSLAGCLARVFTTATETGDKTLWWSFVSASILNGVIALQMLWYWNQAPAKAVHSAINEKVQEKKRRDEVESIRTSAVPVAIPAGATPVKPTTNIGSTPRSATKSASRASSARYTRKVD